MLLHCLGTAGYHPNEERHTSCYFLPESGILLDAGSGAFRLAPLIQTKSIDLLLSHAHLDHVVGLTFLLDVFYQHPIDKLRIWGEQAKLDAVKEHLFSDLIFPVQLEAEFHAIDDRKELVIGSEQQVSVQWRQQKHPGGSVAYRMDWPDRRLLYATDTTGDASCEALQWGKGTDLLMHECYFRDDAKEWAEKTGHSWSSRVIEVTQGILPKKLLLTHVNPLTKTVDGEDTSIDVDRIDSLVDAEVILAEDNLVVEF